LNWYFKEEDKPLIEANGDAILEEKEVIELLCITPRCLTSLKAARLPYFQISTGRFYLASNIIAWAKDQQEKDVNYEPTESRPIYNRPG
jgi:hypothetical protein